MKQAPPSSDDHDLALRQMLTRADREDLSLLVDYLTASGERRRAHSEAARLLLRAQAAGAYPAKAIDAMVGELKRFGGHSIIQLLRRDDGPSYLEIVRDVARHFKVPCSEADGVEVLEARILEALVAQAWEQMTPAERAALLAGLGDAAGGPAVLAGALAAVQLGGFAAYRIALFAAHAIAASLAGRRLRVAANATLERSVRVLAGPVTWAVSAVWTAFDLASPAYRVTVPCVVQIAYMRRKQSLHICPVCDAPNVRAARFCDQCGAELSPSVAS